MEGDESVHLDDLSSSSTKPRLNRITKACYNCSSRKKRCDGQLPVCSACIARGSECSYIDTGRKRGRKPALGAHTSQQKQQRTSNTNTSANRPVDASSASPSASPPDDDLDVTQVASTSRPMIPLRTSSSDVSYHAPAARPPSPRLPPLWSHHGSDPSSSSSNARLLPPAARPPPRSPPPSFEDHASARGLSSGLQFVRRFVGSNDLTAPPSSEPFGPAIVTCEDCNRMGAPCSVCLPDSEIHNCLQLYWKHVHVHWILLYKPFFQALTTQELRTTVSARLLWAMCATGRMLEETPDNDKATLARRYASRAMTALYEDCLQPSLASLQTCLILSIFFLGLGDLQRSFTHIGTAHSMTMALGLYDHNPETAGSGMHSEMNLRVSARNWESRAFQRPVTDPSAPSQQLPQAAWSTYLIDKVIAAEIGRFPLVSWSLLNLPFLSEMEADEFEVVVHHSSASGGQPTARQALGRTYVSSAYNLTIASFRILDQVLSSLYRRHLAQHDRSSHDGDRTNSQRTERRGVPNAHSTDEIKTACVRFSECLAQLQKVAPKHLMLPMPIAEPSSTGPNHGSALGGGVAFAVVWLYTTSCLIHRPWLPEEPFDEATFTPSTEQERLALQAQQASGVAIKQLISAIAIAEATGLDVALIAPNNGYALFTCATVLLFFGRSRDPREVEWSVRQLARVTQWLSKLVRSWPGAAYYLRLIQAARNRQGQQSESARAGAEMGSALNAPSFDSSSWYMPLSDNNGSQINLAANNGVKTSSAPLNGNTPSRSGNYQDDFSLPDDSELVDLSRIFMEDADFMNLLDSVVDASNSREPMT